MNLNCVKTLLISVLLIVVTEYTLCSKPNGDDFLEFAFHSTEVERKWWGILGNKAKLKLHFVITNISKGTMWVCVSRSYTERFTIDINTENTYKVLKIKLKSYAFNRNVVMLEAPVKARFQKVLPGEQVKYDVDILFPIKTLHSVRLEDISIVRVELQYYPDIAIRGNKKCCESTSNFKMVLVDSFWAHSNPGNSVIAEMLIDKNHKSMSENKN